jgi:hypothetical protein
MAPSFAGITTLARAVAGALAADRTVLWPFAALIEAASAHDNIVSFNRRMFTIRRRMLIMPRMSSSRIQYLGMEM